MILLGTDFMRYTQNVYLLRNYRGITMNHVKIVQMADDLTSTTSVDKAGNLIAENLHMTSENADFNGLIHSCNSEGLNSVSPRPEF